MFSPNLIKCLIALFLLPVSLFAQADANFRPIPASYDINSANPVYALDVNYDELDVNRQAFHLFLPDTSGTYPLVVFIHGGGFTGGGRDVVLDNPERIGDIKYFLERGVAFASIGYRVLATNGPDTEGVIKSLSDAKRALQFLRYYATDLHLSPEQFALYGTSAGAGTGLWLGLRSDMADPEATDPVLRESTRVCAVAAGGSQSTYDLYRWETDVYNDFDGQGTNFTLDSIVELLTFERASNFYGGLDSTYQIIHDEALIQYRQDVDMLYHMSADDPPIYVVSNSVAVHPSQDLFHHSFHGALIVQEALAANLPEVKASIRARGINTTDGESRNEFLLRHLNACGQTTSGQDLTIDQEINLFPNPAQEQITVDLRGKGSLVTARLFASSGRLLLRRDLWQVTKVTLPVAALKPGVYVLQVTNEAGRVFVRKVIVG
ncbi:MAG: T9SS type A sorting domain-containing protein [Bacteroidota bacterium]